MIRRIIVIALTLFFTFSVVSASFAMEKGNKRKGKFNYRKVYKTCFERGEVESKIPPINPSDKTQAEWEALYNEKDFTQFGCAEEWGQLKDTQIKDIFTYLYEHASDSPSPAQCK